MAAVHLRHTRGEYKEVGWMLPKNERIVMYYRSVLLHTSMHRRAVKDRRVALTSRGRLFMLCERRAGGGGGGSLVGGGIAGMIDKEEVNRIKRLERNRRAAEKKRKTPQDFMNEGDGSRAEWRLELVIDQPVFSDIENNSVRGGGGHRGDRKGPDHSSTEKEKKKKMKKKKKKHTSDHAWQGTKMKVAEAGGSGGSWVVEFAPEHHTGGTDGGEEEAEDPFSQLMKELEHGTKDEDEDARRQRQRRRKKRRRVPPVLSAAALNQLVRPVTVEQWVASWWARETVLQRWREKKYRPTR